MEPFLADLTETLELEALDPAQVLEDLPEWDSLAALTVIAMIDAKYGVNLAAGELKGGLTAQGLHTLVHRKKAG